MLTPDYVLQMSEGAEEISSALHIDIIKRIVDRIMLRLSRGEDYILTAQDKWQIETLEQAGFLREDIAREIAEKTKLQYVEIKDAFKGAGIEAIKYDNAIYKAAGIDALTLTQSPYLMRLLERGYEATLGDWKNYTRTTADAAQQLFISEMDRAYNLVASGTISATQACKEAVANICKGGVYVTYPTGWRDTIETATLRCVRTGIAQSCGQITAARAAENGITLFLTSSHVGARPTHEVWQGRVFWVDWNELARRWSINIDGHAEATDEEKAKYDEFCAATQIGEIDGLYGINCRHSHAPYIDGVSENPFERYDDEENRKLYDEVQKQRQLERRIRHTKRELLGLREAMDKAQTPETKVAMTEMYQRKARLWEKQNKVYNEYCANHGLKTRQERIEIAQWDRKRAIEAERAARRKEK